MSPIILFNKFVPRLNRWVTGHQVLHGHNSAIFSLALSPDGCIFASGSDDKTVKLWDLTTGRCIKTLQGYSDWIRSVAFSASGMLATRGLDPSIWLWDIDEGHCVGTLQGHGTMQLWNVQTGKCIHIVQAHKNWVWAIAFSP